METERLLLRKLCLEDLPDFFELMSSPAVVRFEPYGVMNLEEVRRELEHRTGNEEFTAVILRNTGKLIGNVYLGRRDFDALELGFLLHEHYWGKGLAQEACRALIKEAFTNGVHRIHAECDPENTASWRLLERLGFTREGHMKQNVYFRRDDLGRPIWKDTYLYSLLDG